MAYSDLRSPRSLLRGCSATEPPGLLALLPPAPLAADAACWCCCWPAGVRARAVKPDLTDVYSDALVSLLYLADCGIAFFDSPGACCVWSPLSVGAFLPRLAAAAHRCWRAPRHAAVWRRIVSLLLLAWSVAWVAQGRQFYEIFFRFDTRATGLLADSLLAALVLEQPA